MKITRGLSHYQRAPHPVLTIGNFDGQHRGHRALLRDVVQQAGIVGGTSMVLTFDPHPAKILAPHVELRFLTTLEQKLAALRKAGIAEVVMLEFTKEFAAMSPAEFVTNILRDGVGAKDLYVGEHFAFGKGRAGRIADLVRFGGEAGIHIHPVPPFRVNGHIVSATRIRQLLQEGEVRTAAQFLGRDYALEGTVMTGARRGQALGAPTANLRLPHDRVIPADGVYATRTEWRGQRYDSVSYIGTRPTFGAGERLLEVSLLDVTVDLYGQPIRVEFVERVRGDQVFQTAEELSAQIVQDIDAARAALKGTQPVSHG
jgi:riboflavin kinase/FMN adenylyltransferase